MCYGLVAYFQYQENGTGGCFHSHSPNPHPPPPSFTLHTFQEVRNSDLLLLILKISLIVGNFLNAGAHQVGV